MCTLTTFKLSKQQKAVLLWIAEREPKHKRHEIQEKMKNEVEGKSLDELDEHEFRAVVQKIKQTSPPDEIYTNPKNLNGVLLRNNDFLGRQATPAERVSISKTVSRLIQRGLLISHPPRVKNRRKLALTDVGIAAVEEIKERFDQALLDEYEKRQSISD